MCVPVGAVMPHEKLVWVNEEKVILEKAFATLSSALHVVIELEYVVVYEKNMPYLYRAIIP